MKTYEIILHPESSFLTPFQADTIFGSICWAIRYMDGEKELEDFLSKYQTSPPLIISNGFPTGFFPKPLREPVAREQLIEIVKQSGKIKNDSKKEIIDILKKLKKFKKEKLINKDVFEEIINGLSENDYLKRKIDEKHEVYYPEKNITLYKNAINRVTSHTNEEGGLFTQDETFYSNETNISFFIKINGIDKEFIEKIFKFISLNGFGKKKTTGKGHFKLIDIKEYKFNSPENPNTFVSLSSFVPSENDPVEGWYDMQVKYGKLGGHYASGNSRTPFKKPVRMFQAGSVFKTNNVKEYYGKLVSNVHSDEKIKQYGYAFAVGMKI
ncbi:MAG: type III-A CRISPR-associated RAMP protein Csm4 [Candidatus Methanoperedens sp.]|uniref:type III-A CRISPR-associated RAMP protein Csm4 n=1 Tax=Candidatus Methanoperedens sp. BLZ2 TaxID=2035255 RepID=UPI000BE29E10|nr:type III-A CRISPR-associated RAMP protein Csm4 [Candidatus Methanoperedens sp. BLZ2]KAB2946736.1 MAG: type III-A CRISPR-associated RAMP protein Csm4 [Candidatus Methanoperedens sp.]MBZ0175844.1 type III-A CRISPR-associated RAMP protein Csm4 [Candidatus Methanoperedens nitroreducens]MCX9079302.1 type III-A CRISPR-associated RAMP protein Csm4 [Candidatus Methanoperedens sp.]